VSDEEPAPLKLFVVLVLLLSTVLSEVLEFKSPSWLFWAWAKPTHRNSSKSAHRLTMTLVSVELVREPTDE